MKSRVLVNPLHILDYILNLAVAHMLIRHSQVKEVNQLCYVWVVIVFSWVFDKAKHPFFRVFVA